MDVVFAIDTSLSMGGANPSPMDEAKQAAIDFANKMASEAPADSMAGVVGWDSTAQPKLDLTKPPNSPIVISTINGLTPGGSTNLDAGLLGAVEVHQNSPRPSTEKSTKVIIFLTDGGGPYTDCSIPTSPAAQAEAENIVIYSIGVGGAITGPLDDMAGCTDGESYPNIQPDTLQQVFDDIFQVIVDSTIPCNINIELIPESGIENLEVLDSHVTQTEPSIVLIDIDDGNCLPAGSSLMFPVQGTVAENASPLNLITSSSNIESTDINGVDFQVENLVDLGAMTMADDCVEPTPPPTPQPTQQPTQCNCPPCTKSSKSTSTKSSKAISKPSKPSLSKGSKSDRSNKSGKRSLMHLHPPVCKCDCTSSTKSSVRPFAFRSPHLCRLIGHCPSLNLTLNLRRSAHARSARAEGREDRAVPESGRATCSRASYQTSWRQVLSSLPACYTSERCSSM